MKYSGKIDSEKQSLIDLVTTCTDGLKEHLGYVVNYLHGNEIRLIAVLRHAEGLLNSNEHPRNYENPETLIQTLTENEIPVVKRYISALTDYLKGQSFHPVREVARELCFSKPIPDTVYAPPGTFSKELIEAYEQV